MAYAEFIRDLLRPLFVYDLDIGAGAAEIEALGDVFDGADTVSQSLHRESNPLTAEDYGIKKYEELFPFGSVYDDAESRRRAIEGLIRIDDGSFTLSDMNATIAGCGIEAVIGETETQYVVSVSFPGRHGVPENIDGIKERIGKILPAHIRADYVYTYPTWEVIETLGTWADIAERNMTWNDIESYMPEE